MWCRIHKALFDSEENPEENHLNLNLTKTMGECEDKEICRLRKGCPAQGTASWPKVGSPYLIGSLSSCPWPLKWPELSSVLTLLYISPRRARRNHPDIYTKVFSVSGWFRDNSRDGAVLNSSDSLSLKLVSYNKTFVCKHLCTAHNMTGRAKYIKPNENCIKEDGYGSKSIK